jgi:predicted nucleic acid-binding protein
VKIALDTNVLAYAHGVTGIAMRRRALELLAALPDEGIVLPAQVLGELFNVLVRKARWDRVKARAAVLDLQDAYAIVDTSRAVLVRATDLAATHALSIWDAVVLSAAAERDCRLLLSEDMQSGFTWQGVTVADPFAVERHPLLAAVLTQPDRR